VAYFSTLAPGSALPSGETCATLVRATPEHRSANAGYNSAAASGSPPPIDGATSAFNTAYAGRIDGNFSGTTDEILQWASCKWGFDENITRARAWTESWWFQSFYGDNGQSCGILQVKGWVHEQTWPRACDSTAFNADYSLAWLRACYEGAFPWLGQYGTTQYGPYQAGDLWGCIGAWYSGTWNTNGSRDYQGWVQANLANRPWDALLP